MILRAALTSFQTWSIGRLTDLCTSKSKENSVYRDTIHSGKKQVSDWKEVFAAYRLQTTFV